MDHIARHLIIHGLVQGVGFRYATALEANRLGLTGWVRNRSDGTVEAVIAGKADAVALMLRWVEHGPPSASVERIEQTAWHETIGSGFTQLPTV